jgi:hypothetical protein
MPLRQQSGTLLSSVSLATGFCADPLWHPMTQAKLDMSAISSRSVAAKRSTAFPSGTNFKADRRHIANWFILALIGILESPISIRDFEEPNL